MNVRQIINSCILIVHPYDNNSDKSSSYRAKRHTYR